MPKSPGRAFQKDPGQPYKPFAGNTQAQPLSAPTNVSAARVGTTSSAKLVWGPPVSTGGRVITGYRVARDGSDTGGYGAFTTVVEATVREFT